MGNHFQTFRNEVLVSSSKVQTFKLLQITEWCHFTGQDTYNLEYENIALSLNVRNVPPSDRAPYRTRTETQLHRCENLNNISFLFILIQHFLYFDSCWGSFLQNKTYFLILDVLSISCHYKMYLQLQVHGFPSNKPILDIYSFLLLHCTIYADERAPLTPTKVKKSVVAKYVLLHVHVLEPWSTFKLKIKHMSLLLLYSSSSLYVTLVKHL